MMGVSAAATMIGSSTSHQNSIHTIAAPSFLALHAALPSLSTTEPLYDGAGQHLGGIYQPLLLGGAFTTAYTACVATRPAHDLLWRVDLCAEPTVQLGLVWMVPPCPDPPMFSAAAVGYVVAALDAGQSVAVHAGNRAEIAAVRATVGPLVGGGHT